MAQPSPAPRRSNPSAPDTRKPLRLNRRQLVAAVCAVAALVLLAIALLWPQERGTYVPYADFAHDLKSGRIASATIAPGEVSFALRDDPAAYYTDNPAAPDLQERLLLSGAQVENDAGAQGVLDVTLDLFFYGMFFGTFAVIVYKLASYSRNTFKVVRRTGVSFDDIAGMEQPKRELARLVEVLKDPQRYAGQGVRPVKGVVLEGPPGNGKTLFARALATEAGVDFIATRGADFQSALMSLGSRKIRTLFRKAARHEPCIVFIDEFDSIGERRNYAGTGVDKENNRIITAMLNEMDGFETGRRVLVVAATNSYRSLDPALIRPGRFDLKFTVGNPDAATRAELVRLYTVRAGRELAPDLTSAKLIDAFDGLSCVAIEAVLNGAAAEALVDGGGERGSQRPVQITAAQVRSAAAKADVRLKEGVL